MKEEKFAIEKDHVPIYGRTVKCTFGHSHPVMIYFFNGIFRDTLLLGNLAIRIDFVHF
jgi:hypothetical protein